jgi:4-diphosphocytidyl-2-C-methyl-D-erythritol kinase
MANRLGRQRGGLGAQARLPAPAKLNLFLHVLGRREDGRHELQTVFQLLDFGDEIELECREDSQIVLRTPLQDVPVEQDLCVRAARLLQAHTGSQQGVDIHCLKRIPMGGGLGGGSSDAATCLVGLNALWGLKLDLDTLAELGLSLGADVPVFVRGTSAFAQGVGERLQPLKLPEAWFCIVTPDCRVPTGQIFAAQELTRNTQPVTISNLLGQRAVLRNDCWPVVASRFPAVRDAFKRLSEFGDARMSGTGASVFLQCASRNEALHVAAQMPENWQAFVAQGLNESPLHEAAQRLITGV